MDNEFRTKFLTNTEHTGRHIVYSFRTGKSYFVEPIEGNVVKWGDLDPATGKLTGDYGSKYRGGIYSKDSLDTKT